LCRYCCKSPRGTGRGVDAGRGFIGPFAVGWVLDLRGGMSPAAWATAFTMIAVLMLMALAAFLIMRPSALAGDRRGDEIRAKASD